MYIADNTVKSIINFLSDQPDISSCQIVSSFDSNTLPITFDKGVVAVGIDSIKFSDYITEYDLEKNVIDNVHRQALIKVKLDFYVSNYKGSSTMYDLMDECFTNLLFKYGLKTSTKVIEGSYGEVKFDRDINSLTCEANITLSTLVKK